jgi:hypothetical protein
LAVHLDRLDKLIGANNFLLGYLTEADFFIYHLVKHLNNGFPGKNPTAAYANLTRHNANFET